MLLTSISCSLTRLALHGLFLLVFFMLKIFLYCWMKSTLFSQSVLFFSCWFHEVFREVFFLCFKVMNHNLETCKCLLYYCSDGNSTMYRSCQYFLISNLLQVFCWTWWIDKEGSTSCLGLLVAKISLDKSFIAVLWKCSYAAITHAVVKAAHFHRPATQRF